jgi:hypothetical protein
VTAAAAARLVRLRLASQRLSGARFDTPVEVVRWMTAMQAQDFAGAKWAVGLRTDSATDRDVEDALTRGEIVRSWPMRGTLHFVAAEDLGWMLAATSERLINGAAARRAALGLTMELLETARGAAIQALSGSRALTREQMHAVFETVGISPEGQRGYHVLWHLSQTGTLCFGPPKRTQQTFVLLDEWVPAPRRLDPDEAIAEWCLRYFRSHGPATIRDFAWWSSLTLTAARRALESVRDALDVLHVDGTEYFHAPGLEAAPGEVRALPGFDEYLLGYQDRAPQLAPEHAHTVTPGKNGVFKPTIVRDGFVVGTWKRSGTARQVRLQVQPFAKLSQRTRTGFVREAVRYGSFLGVPVSVDPPLMPPATL